MISYKEKLNKVKYFIFDVDGVLTDGLMYLLDDKFVRALNAKDGYAMQYAVKSGYKIFIITGGESQEVKKAMNLFGIDEVHLLSHDKVKVYEMLQAKYNFADEEVLYMGDDLNDFGVMQRVGVKTCPQDAVSEIKEICDYQSPLLGGKTCARDVIKQTLMVQGQWNDPARAYTW